MSTCYYPLRISRDSEKNIIFTNDGTPSLPCGQCIGCRLQRAEAWAIRMVHESQLHEENSFLTLTYNDEHLPCNKNLSYRELTLFIKRLRKVLKSTSYNGKIKYYAVGEYGENFSRPHYHVIVFGFNFTNKNIRYKGENNKIEPLGKSLFASTLLNNLWGKGNCAVDEVNYNTCMYVAKYVTKKVTGKNKDSHYQRINDDGEIIQVEPEKARMSKGGTNRKTKQKTSYPIGHEWIEKFTSDVYPRDHVIHEAKRLKTPAYYDKWLEKNNPTLFEQIKQSREASVLDTPQKTQSDLTRIHEVKLVNSMNNNRSLEGTPTISEHEKYLLEYSKREQQFLRLSQKGNL